jgi:hypothetical protein
VNASFVLRRGLLDGCDILHVFERAINVVDVNNTVVNLATCHDARPVAGGQVLYH